jgi:DNA-binding XRE family transcriptional regulator
VVDGAAPGPEYPSARAFGAPLDGELWELREESATNIYRVIYFFSTGRRIVLLHGFQKKSERIPRGELEAARRRHRGFLAREGGRHLMKDSVGDEGQARYDAYWAGHMADPDFQRAYEEESQKKELWLALVEARQAAGLTQADLARRLGVSQAQVARIEKRGYDSYTLNTLRRYVAALGEGFSVEVLVRKPQEARVTPGRKRNSVATST